MVQNEKAHEKMKNERCLERGSGEKDSSCLERVVVWREGSSGLALERILLVWHWDFSGLLEF